MFLYKFAKIGGTAEGKELFVLSYNLGREVLFGFKILEKEK